MLSLTILLNVLRLISADLVGSERYLDTHQDMKKPPCGGLLGVELASAAG